MPDELDPYEQIIYDYQTDYTTYPIAIWHLFYGGTTPDFQKQIIVLNEIIDVSKTKSTYNKKRQKYSEIYAKDKNA